jgi:hypothetical protein
VLIEGQDEGVLRYVQRKKINLEPGRAHRRELQDQKIVTSLVAIRASAISLDLRGNPMEKEKTSLVHRILDQVHQKNGEKRRKNHGKSQMERKSGEEIRDKILKNLYKKLYSSYAV